MGSNKYKYMLYNQVCDNSAMYHELGLELYYTGNIIIIELNSIINGTRETKYFGDLCCKILINVNTCDINMFILADIIINNTW